LDFDFHYHGTKDKFKLYQEIKLNYNLQDHQIAYIGDDIIDIPLIKACGLGIVPSDAIYYICDFANLITYARGGSGVLREVADFILAAQGKFDEVLNYYLFNKE
jgi:3-deoxy-D-manno-octulosonate 8-phosphate phosphatase (KDO 8-P phosphatase)